MRNLQEANSELWNSGGGSDPAKIFQSQDKQIENLM